MRSERHHSAPPRRAGTDQASRLAPLISGSAYVNHLASDDKPEKVRASVGANHERLAALKQQYDPTNLFRLNPNVKPRS